MSDGQDLLPLSIAAQFAYFELTRIDARAQRESDLAEATQRTAIALAQIAPIYASAAAGEILPLSGKQIEELLFRSSGPGPGGPAPLDSVQIRRADLSAALEALKEAAAGRARGD